MKPNESRAEKFKARYGRDATEVDAFEALHAGAFEDIVREEIERYIDPTLEDRVREAMAPVQLSERRGGVFATPR
jgi:hypothetical protein